MSDRNPYVMLGVPFGSPRDVATRAFARKAKGQRRSRSRVSESKGELTDLTWALNQVSEAIRDPRTALDVYRVPADPNALEPTGEGVLRPGPENMPRTTASSDAEWARLLDAAREEAVAVLHEEIASTAALPER
ncbi:MAG: hypothetical protein WAW88_15810 [Nocardioides sp.]